MKKKILSIAIAICMTVTLLPIGVFANNKPVDASGVTESDITVDSGDVTEIDKSADTFDMTEVAIPVNTDVKVDHVDENIAGWNNPFEDVNEKDWFYESVLRAHELGLMQGTSASTFEPDTNTTRGMIVTVLYNLAGKPDIETDDTVWYAKSRAWAMETGISDGKSMEENITREQLVTMLWRNAGKPMLADYEGLISFSDVTEISDYAIYAMMWAHQKDIINGKENGILDPKGSTTRAEAAAMIISYFNSTQK